MTKKTRIRVARIAAGAIIAAGASLTAAGAASALDLGVTVDENGVSADVNLDGPASPDPTDTIVPTAPNTPTEEPPTEEPPTQEPPTQEPPTSIPPSDDPTEPTDNPTEPTDEPTTADPTSGSGSTGGNSNTDPDGGSSAQEAGTSALTDTGSDTAAQGNGDQLAETGAGQTAFLLIGAATMIAGGIAFRVLPRLASSNRGGTIA